MDSKVSPNCSKLKQIDSISTISQCSSCDKNTEFTSNSILKTPWNSILLTGGFAICTGIQFGLFFSSIWPYMQILDPLSRESFLGWIVASYSFGQIIASPLVGFISNRMKSIRLPIVFCIFMQMLGNIIYGCAQLVDSNRRWAILAARFVNGIGATNIGLIKTFCASASTVEDRSRAIAVGTGGLALGLAIGPAIQMIFVPIGFPGWSITENFQLSMYTAPAIFACFVNLIAIVVMLFLFEEKYAGLVNEKVEKDQEKVYIPPYDRLALLACYIGRFSQMFIFTNVETLSAPYAMTLFAWTKTEAVSFVALSHVAVSILELFMYAGFILLKLDRWLNLRLNCVIGFFGLVLYYILTFSWPFLPGQLKTFTENDYLSYLASNGTLDEPVGCNVDKLPWCLDVKPVNIWLYYISYVFFMGACFCLINITLNTIFSQVIGPRRQATHQGILQMAGSIGRLIGPLIISNLYSLFGPPLAWSIQIVLLAITIGTWILVYNRLIPLEVPEINPNFTPKIKQQIFDEIQTNDLKKKPFEM